MEYTANKGIKVLQENVKAVDNQEQSIVDEILNSEFQIVWYPGSADDLVPCLWMNDIKEIADDGRSNTIFILTELEDDNSKREMFAKSKQGTYEFNIQSNGGGVKEEIKERIVIEQCIRINISDVVKDTICNGKLMVANIDDKKVTILYLAPIDMMDFLYHFIYSLKVHIQCLIFKEMNTDTILEAYQTNCFVLPEYIIINRENSVRYVETMESMSLLTKGEFGKYYYNNNNIDEIYVYRNTDERRQPAILLEEYHQRCYKRVHSHIEYQTSDIRDRLENFLYEKWKCIEVNVKSIKIRDIHNIGFNSYEAVLDVIVTTVAGYDSDNLKEEKVEIVAYYRISNINVDNMNGIAGEILFHNSSQKKETIEVIRKETQAVIPSDEYKAKVYQCAKDYIENKIDEMIDTLRYDLAILPGWSDCDVESMTVKEIETTDFISYDIKMLVTLSDEEQNVDIYVYYQMNSKNGEMQEIYYKNNSNIEDAIEEKMCDEWI